MEKMTARTLRNRLFKIEAQDEIVKEEVLGLKLNLTVRECRNILFEIKHQDAEISEEELKELFKKNGFLLRRNELNEALRDINYEREFLNDILDNSYIAASRKNDFDIPKDMLDFGIKELKEALEKLEIARNKL